MKYQSAKSIGFAMLFWGVVIILFASNILIPGSYRLLMAVASLAASGFLLWIWYGTFYEFRDIYLAIRMGPFFENIEYARISSIRPLKSMASSMSLSSEMIEIRHGKSYITGTTYISPINREAFIIELQKRCMNINESVL